MPMRDYQRKQLPRLLTNELFRQIEASDVPVTDFELTQRTVTIKWRYDDIIAVLLYRNRDPESRAAAVIDHSRSRSSFRIVQTREDGFIYRSLTDSAMPLEEELQLVWLAYKGRSLNWNAVTDAFGTWLEEIKVSQKDPDLWEELKRNGASLGNEHEHEHEHDIGNTPFTFDEQADVSAQIKQVKDYIKTTFELTSEQIARVDETLDQAEKASHHLGRKDWLLLFNGAVFSLILTDLITPQGAEHIIMLTIHGLGHLFGFGGPPLHLPPGG
jgi:hypothetical protein